MKHVGIWPICAYISTVAAMRLILLNYGTHNYTMPQEMTTRPGSKKSQRKEIANIRDTPCPSVTISYNIWQVSNPIIHMGHAQPAREKILELENDADLDRLKRGGRELRLLWIILHNISIYGILFPPQLVSPAFEPLKRNPTPCHKF